MKIFTQLMLFTALAVGARGAEAGEKAGVTLPDTITVAGKPLVLNGMGLREATFLGIDVYVAGLYLEHPTSNAGQIIGSDEVKLLVLRFVRDVDHGDIVKAWTEGFAKNATVPVPRIRPMIDQLNAWMPSFKKGDTLTFSYVPGRGVEVAVNTARKGTIQDADFAHSLFAIWLGAKPPNSALKRGLLGNHRPGV